MAKTFEQKCLQCKHSLRDPNATPDQVIAGQVPHLCVEGPPLTVPMPTSRGVAMMTIRPMVTADTISCSRFACETDDCLECGGMQGKHYGHCSKAREWVAQAASAGQPKKG